MPLPCHSEWTRPQTTVRNGTNEESVQGSFND